MVVIISDLLGHQSIICYFMEDIDEKYIADLENFLYKLGFECSSCERGVGDEYLVSIVISGEVKKTFKASTKLGAYQMLFRHLIECKIYCFLCSPFVV